MSIFIMGHLHMHFIRQNLHVFDLHEMEGYSLVQHMYSINKLLFSSEGSIKYLQTHYSEFQSMKYQIHLCKGIKGTPTT